MFPACNAAFKLILRLFNDCEITGREQVPDRGPIILIANHISNVDPALVAVVSKKPPRILAKKELFSFPLFSFLLRSYGAYPVDRGKADLHAMNWAERHLLQNEGSLVLFPEGTRDRDGRGMKRGQVGVAQLAADTGAAIVPIGLTGTEGLQNVLRVFWPGARIRLNVGQPFEIKTIEGRRPTRQELNGITTEIMVRIAVLLPERMRGFYQDATGQPFAYTRDFP